MRRAGERGSSLLELLIVVSLLGILAQAAAPDFRRAFETRRVDEAQSVLRSLWSAERMYWLEHAEYTDDLEGLVEAHLIEAAVLADDGPFVIVIDEADSHGFLGRAVRTASSAWSGSISIDERGTLGGAVLGKGGIRVTPSPE